MKIIFRKTDLPLLQIRTPDRIKSWHRGDMGLSVPTGEEDPDPLSYGVCTQWMIHFGR